METIYSYRTLTFIITTVDVGRKLAVIDGLWVHVFWGYVGPKLMWIASD